MDLFAEIKKVNGSKNNYQCTVYSAYKRTEIIYGEDPYKNRKVTLFFEENFVLDHDTGETEPYEPPKIKEEKVTYENKQKLCVLTLSATQASKNKAAKVINRRLGEMGYGKKIDSADITQLFQ